MKVKVALLVLVLLLVFNPQAGAYVGVVVDGEEMFFEKPPLVVNNRTLLPMRDLFKTIGARITWEQETQTAVGSRGDIEVRVPAGGDIIAVNGTGEGSEEYLDASARLVNGRTYVPLRAVSSVLGDEVTWDGSSHTVYINTAPSAFEDEVPTSSRTVRVVNTVEGTASWYGSRFHGRSTASGEVFDQNAFTAAHRELPFGTYVRVTYLSTGKSTIVRINDRGPHIAGRIIDLSRAAAEAIGMKYLGTVRLEVLDINDG